MADRDPILDPEALSDDQGAADEAPARAASVRLREQESASAMAGRRRMDAANQSLADALRITYGLLRGAMIVLVVLFLISGVQSIKEGERGLALRFGRPVRQNLDPGFQWSWPYPIGEIVRVGEGTVELPIATAFMPNLPGDNTEEAAMTADLDRFNSSQSLKPGSDGSNITADLNIAHTQWSVNYHRSDHLKAVQNIAPEQERMIIRTMVERGAVQVLSTTTIDDLLKQSAETISARVREIAQRSLDELDTGITLDRVVLTRKSAAMSLQRKFTSVQTKAQEAGKAREDALLKRDQTLNEVAGRASTVLIDEINEYERLTELGEDARAEAQLGRINKILLGEAVEIDGEMVAGLVSGEVSEMLDEARTEASNRVSEAIAAKQLFESKLAQYEANPKVMIVRDWSLAMGEFLDQDFVSTIMLPEGVDAEMFINNDPDIARELDRMRKRREAQEAKDLRQEELRRSYFRSRRGIEDTEE